LAVALFFAVGEWTHKSTGPDDDNQGGFLIAGMCLLILACIYAASAAGSLEKRIRGDRSERGPKAPNGNEDA
jgi:hypothetical protein